jgi:hypothetical protein
VGWLALLLVSTPRAFPQRAPWKIDPLGTTVESRFPAPAGFAREAAPDDSFASYLRRLPLKPDGAQVKLYDGRVKPDHGVYAAVADLPIGSRDLHQCADAIIRLRAEYLFAQGRFGAIRFRFTSGFLAEYSRWQRGERVRVQGNTVSWRRAAAPSSSPEQFWKYLETVFSYAGTASLARELDWAGAGPPRSGDVFIQPGRGQGGRAGHAVIVVDEAVCRETGRRVFLLAQSYMPAQEIQVLRNPGDSDLSPWYDSAFGPELRTPEWTFAAGDLKRFREE